MSDLIKKYLVPSEEELSSITTGSSGEESAGGIDNVGPPTAESSLAVEEGSCGDETGAGDTSNGGVTNPGEREDEGEGAVRVAAARNRRDSVVVEYGITRRQTDDRPGDGAATMSSEEESVLREKQDGGQVADGGRADDRSPTKDGE